MAVFTKKIQLATQGRSQVLNITDHAAEALQESRLQAGILTAFVPGSTAGITTVEYEPGLIADLKAAVERLAPRTLAYQHNEQAGDDNGQSHIQAALVGPSVTVPFRDQRLLLGTWQQIVLLDFDMHPRTRSLIFQVMGE